MKKFLIKLSILGVVTICPLLNSVASAFCLENKTDSRLFFAVTPSNSILPGFFFSKWLDADEMVCNSDDHRVNKPMIFRISVFANLDDVEGCGAEVLPDGQLKLLQFIQFDRCEWEKD